MAQPRDNGDVFKKSWNTYTSYPTNLCRTIHFNHTLESYLSFLDECEKSRHAVFRRGRSKICVMDLADGDSVFEQPSSIRDSEQLDNRFSSTRRDPISRFIFIQARSNRDSLLCSKDQFSRIMTHHQVMPSFLDLATTFKRPEHGSGQSLFMTFHHEDFLSDADKSWNIPSLGRSGLQSQHCFNLIAPEFSKESLWKWPLRQTVSYHSFDPAEGRSCWVILKGNNLIQERLSKAAQEDDPLKGSSLSSNEKRFIATLYAHLVIFEWCAEHWGHYIEYLEEQMTPVLKSKQAPVDSIVKMDHIDRSVQHQAIALSPRSTFARSGATSPPATPHASITFPHAPARVSSLSNAVTAKIGKWPRLSLSRRHEGELVTNPESTVAPALVADPDKEFTFSQLQEQSRLADYGEEALLVMEQNLDIIREIKRRYKAVIEFEQFKAHIDVDACRSEIYAFGQRVRGVERILENQRRRLQTRTRILSNNKDLYQVVLQFKNMKTSEYFATSAKVSSDEMHLMTEQMKEIAIKTEQETVSMHAITILTLGFLPSTFLAVRFGLPVLRNFLSATLTFCQTFFSSGIIQFEEGAEWVLRTDALRLFLAICLPLTALILIGWAVGYRRFRRSRRPQLTTLEYGELPLKREPERASGANRAQLV